MDRVGIGKSLERDPHRLGARRGRRERSEQDCCDSQKAREGAQVTVKAGDLLVYREVKGSEGFGATSPYRQHFGLGKKGKIDSLEIRWPSGLTQRFAGLDTNQIISVAEGDAAWKRLK